jgi:hypothetical protein
MVSPMRIVMGTAEQCANINEVVMKKKGTRF